MKPPATRPAACRRRSAATCGVAAVIALLASALATSATAVASAPRPHWAIISTSAPTYFKPGDENDFYEVIAINDGDAPTDGSTFTVAATLPSGVTATASFGEAITGLHGSLAEGMSCSTVQSCESAVIVPIGELVKVKVLVSVSPEASGDLHSSATISGGGAATSTASQTTTVSAEPVPFGAALESDLVTAEGGASSQAGSHPSAFTTIMVFNVSAINKASECPLVHNFSPGCALLNADVKDLDVGLPRGLVGDPTAVPRCTQTTFQTYGSKGCPPDTQVGIIHLGFYGNATALQYASVYNIEPPPGQPAELGFSFAGFIHIPIYFRVRSDGDYALAAHLSGISEADPLHFGALTIWGVPASPIHNPQREGQATPPCEFEGCIVNSEQKPFLTLPAACPGSELQMSVSGDSWQQPTLLGELPLLSVARMPAMTGCEALSFTPSIEVAPDTLQAGAPAGYSVSIKVPQNKDPEGFATPDVRDVQLTLPLGTVLSPAGANGLSACTQQQFELRSGAQGHCPAQAKVGQVNVTSPLLEGPLRGSVFVGAPECAPCSPEDAHDGKMVPLLIEVGGFGIVIKLAGHTSVDQATGQLTTTFTENPQLPFSDLEVSLKGGDNAPLVNPTACGNVVAKAKLTPWSTMTATETTGPVIPVSNCAAPGFSPTLQAGSAIARAGAFTDFAVHLSRSDGQQDLATVAVQTPPGLLGMLSKVQLCGEGQANAGTCTAASEIGAASVSVGSGSRPLTVTGGKVYLTGPYEDKPFGLSVVMPTEAGPFQLEGNTGGAKEVVRASIAVDPHTAAVTILSRALPSHLEGIPLHIRSIDVTVNRAEFMFNPTDCDPLSVGGEVTSTTGTRAVISAPFQAVNCAGLAFRPTFAVTTEAKTSKARGASLHVRVASGSGQANIGAVKVDLPKQLPSRLATLQKACVAAVFEANSANCPAASAVGIAKAATPVLNNPLSGPAYLVSHGGAAFPDLEIVLQGQGITLILDGKTRIRNGITSSTFRSLPDAPISTFELTLPGGLHSVLAANLSVRAHHSMCGQKLAMPTVITGQNGAVVKRTTRVTVSGCRAKSARKQRGAKSTTR
jgi:hypothetical protein